MYLPTKTVPTQNILLVFLSKNYFYQKYWIKCSFCI